MSFHNQHRRAVGRPATNAATYGKLTLRLPEVMHQEIRELADQDLRGLNSYILVLLDFALEHYPYTQAPKSERLLAAAEERQAS